MSKENMNKLNMQPKNTNNRSSSSNTIDMKKKIYEKNCMKEKEYRTHDLITNESIMYKNNEIYDKEKYRRNQENINHMSSNYMDKNINHHHEYDNMKKKNYSNNNIYNNNSSNKVSMDEEKRKNLDNNTYPYPMYENVKEIEKNKVQQNLFHISKENNNNNNDSTNNNSVYDYNMSNSNYGSKMGSNNINDSTNYYNMREKNIYNILCNNDSNNYVLFNSNEKYSMNNKISNSILSNMIMNKQDNNNININQNNNNNNNMNEGGSETLYSSFTKEIEKLKKEVRKCEESYDKEMVEIQNTKKEIKYLRENNKNDELNNIFSELNLENISKYLLSAYEKYGLNVFIKVLVYKNDLGHINDHIKKQDDVNMEFFINISVDKIFDYLLLKKNIITMVNIKKLKEKFIQGQKIYELVKNETNKMIIENIKEYNFIFILWKHNNMNDLYERKQVIFNFIIKIIDKIIPKYIINEYIIIRKNEIYEIMINSLNKKNEYEKKNKDISSSQYLEKENTYNNLYKKIKDEKRIVDNYSIEMHAEKNITNPIYMSQREDNSTPNSKKNCSNTNHIMSINHSNMNNTKNTNNHNNNNNNNNYVVNHTTHSTSFYYLHNEKPSNVNTDNQKEIKDDNVHMKFQSLPENIRIGVFKNDVNKFYEIYKMMNAGNDLNSLMYKNSGHIKNKVNNEPYSNNYKRNTFCTNDINFAASAQQSFMNKNVINSMNNNM
ncbi:MATH and LRR domain-containing protein, partial [Plasmodium falciparum Tanzania (2000708)]